MLVDVDDNDDDDFENGYDNMDMSTNGNELQRMSHSSVKVGGRYSLPKFHGEKNQDLEVFLRQFDVCARNMNWNQAERMDSMQLALSGRAASMIVQYVHLCYDQFLVELRRNFGNEHQTAHYQARLKTYRRAPDETIQQL